MKHRTHACTTLAHLLLSLLAVFAANGQAPATPTDVSASDGTVCGAVRITWNPVAGATAYLVYCGGIFAGQAAQPLYDHSVGDNWVRSYAVQATNNEGASLPGGPDSGFAAMPPVPPSNVSASQWDCREVGITWNFVSGATMYEVYRDGILIGSFNPCVGPFCNNWMDVVPPDSFPHSYTVRAGNGCGWSFMSSPAIGFIQSPSAPTEVSASQGTRCGAVFLIWNPSTQVDYYSIRRDGHLIATVVSTTSYTDYPNDTFSHSYTVAACNNQCECAVSVADFGYAGAPTPAPAAVNASDGGVCGTVHLSWDAVAGATGYWIYRDYYFAAQTTGTNYDDTLSDTNLHFYTVRAENIRCLSDFSSPDSGYALQRTMSVVTTTNDSGPGSLRQAIQDANAGCGGDITFSNVNGTVTLTSGELVSSSAVAIIGPGPTYLAISGNNASRVFNITSNVTVFISGLTITNGRTAAGTNGIGSPGSPGGSGSPGGAICSSATLTLSNCVLAGNRAGSGGTGFRDNGGDGGKGGAVFNDGTLTVVNCTITNNSSGAGGDCSGYEIGPAFAGGAGGAGGSIYNAGTLTATNCVLSANRTGDGGAGSIGEIRGASGGPGGDGGGIFNIGSLTLGDCTLQRNATGAAGGGPYQGRANDGGKGGAVLNGGVLAVDHCSFGSNLTGVGGRALDGGAGNGGGGAAFYNWGMLTMSSCILTNNRTGSGGQGYYGGNGGNGGAILNMNLLVLNQSSLGVNSTGAGGESLYWSSGGGRGGSGAGIYSRGALTMTNSTLSGNQAGDGGSVSWSGYGTGGPGGSGGGVHIDGSLFLNSCTIARNSAGAGGTGPQGAGSEGTGGGIVSAATSVGPLNNIIALNVRGDVSGSFASLGNNLVGVADGSVGFTNGVQQDLVGTAASPLEPWLAPLANNGGSTLTCALLPGSPAIEAGANYGAPAFDQRGVPRPQGAAVDIGSFEYEGLMPCHYVLSFTNVAFGPTGGTGTVTVTVAAGCSWAVGNTNNWITITGGSTGLGAGAVSFTAQTNSNTNSRTGMFSVADQTVTVTQAGLIPPASSGLVAWGDNDSGQTSVPAGLGNMVAVAAGYNHNLALQEDGTVVAWGGNGSGQTNVPAGLASVTAIAAGWGTSLALAAGGAVADWGWRDVAVTNFFPAGLQNIASIAAGYDHLLAITPGSNMVAWGEDYEGEGMIPPGLTKVAVRAVAAGYYHSLALKHDGTVAALGINDARTIIPPGLTSVVAIAAGGYHNLALKADGTVVAWGGSSYGQTNVPAGLTNVTAIAAGDNHSLALKTDGTVIAWGRTNEGQCIIPPGLANVVAISAGGNHNLALVSLEPVPLLVKPQNPRCMAGTFTVSVSTVRGRSYWLDGKDSLSQTQWTLLPPIRGDGGVKVLTDPAANAPQRFYRVRQQ